MNAPFQAFMHRYRETMNGIWIEVFTSAGYGRQASFLIMSTLNLVRGWRSPASGSATSATTKPS